MNDLEKKCLKIRQNVFRTVCQNKAGHLASSLSSVEILVTLYFGDILKYDAGDPQLTTRDRFILSKGHAALAMYYVLAEAGYYNSNEVATFCKFGSKFGGLTTFGKIPGIETTSGSLGHGLSFAAGMAMMGKLNKDNYNVYVLLGDGELQEGEIWEAAMFISHNKLNNLTVIIDNNNIQATGYNKDIIGMDTIENKWNAFGFCTLETDGHNIDSLLKWLNYKSERPKAIIAHTTKGKGLSFAENKGDWHYKMPNVEEIEKGLIELGMTREDLVDYERKL